MTYLNPRQIKYWMSENELAITGAVELRSNFKLIDYNITVTSSNEGGSVSGGKEVFPIVDSRSSGCRNLPVTNFRII